MRFRFWLESVWRYLWYLDRRTRGLLRMDPRAVLELSSEIDADERVRARSLLADGSGTGTGFASQEGSGTDDDGAGGGSAGRSDDGSTFDVDEDYGRKQRVGPVLGPLLFAVILVLPAPAGWSVPGKAVPASSVWIVT